MEAIDDGSQRLMIVASAIASSLHLLALAIGLPSIWLRARALRTPIEPARLGSVFAADTAWGIAALLWLATGPLRTFPRLEKGAQFYLHSRMFGLKMALFVLVLVLELWPMITLIRWRMAVARGQPPDLGQAPALRVLSLVECGLVIAIVFVASLMARGVGFAR